MAFSYWRTGNFGGGEFRAPANQGDQGTQNNSGFCGYGYEAYVPGRYGREGWNKWAFAGSYLRSGIPFASALTDNFDDNSRDTGLWNIGQIKDSTAVTTGVTVSETNSRVEVAPAASSVPAAFSGYVSVNSYDLTNDSFYLKLSNASTITFTAQEVYAAAGGSADNSYGWLLSGGTLYFVQWKAGTRTLLGSSLTYSSTSHAWLRLRYDGTNVYLDTATSSASDPPISGDWTNQYSAARDAAVQLNSCLLGFGSGTYGSVPSPVTVQFDGFNTATTVAADVTAALTGQSVTSSVGSLLATASLALSGADLTIARGSVLQGAPLTGQSTSVAQGTTGLTISVALTGQTLTAARGSVVSTAAPALSGQSLTAAQGTPAAANSEALTGQSSVAAQGSVAQSSSVSLSGQVAVAGSGSVTAGSDIATALTGLGLAGAQGSLVPACALVLSGQAASVAQESASPALSAEISGQSLALASGTISVLVPTDVTRTLTGVGISITQGSVTATAEYHKFWRQPPLIGRRTSAGRSR